MHWHTNHEMGLVHTPQHLTHCPHIPRSENIPADKESKTLKESREWSLSQEIFLCRTDKMGDV